jgi:hypothetical protein
LGLSGAKDSSVSAVALFEAYCIDKKPAASTMNRWRVVFTTLDALPPEEAVQDPDGAQRWLDSLRTEHRSARTVRDIWLSAARTVFKWAVRKRRVLANPFEGCTVEVTAGHPDQGDGEGVYRGRGPEDPAGSLAGRGPPAGHEGRRMGSCPTMGALAVRLHGSTGR